MHMPIGRQTPRQFWSHVNGHAAAMGERMPADSNRHSQFEFLGIPVGPKWPANQTYFAISWPITGRVDRKTPEFGRPGFLVARCGRLDPSIIPSTGTPQPNGLTWLQTMQIIRTLALPRGFSGWGRMWWNSSLRQTLPVAIPRPPGWSRKILAFWHCGRKETVAVKRGGLLGNEKRRSLKSFLYKGLC